MNLRNYTLRYLIVALLGVIALWASLFYMVILEEVYDNIDDGLKNSKILIIREAFADKTILQTRDFGINQYKMEPLPKGPLYDFSDKFISTSEFMEYDNDYEPVRLLETVFNDPEGNPYKLTIRASIVEEDELLEDLMMALIALYAMLVISIAAINHLILKKVWKSFYVLLNGLKSFKLGTGTDFKAPHSPVSEFKMLGNEIEDMLQRNEDVFLNQKQFIENASHELQTPLAISLNKLELFIENNSLEEKQMMEIASVTDTLSRLVRINKSLLLLSKIDNRQFTDEENINFNDLATATVNDFKDLADFRGISINIESKNKLHFKMNKGLAVIFINNLIKNAIVHSAKGGSIKVEINHDSLSVHNSGERALDAGMIFNRFYKDLNKEQSTGLGLSIVHSIAISYGLTVAYNYKAGHIFTVHFPVT